MILIISVRAKKGNSSVYPINLMKDNAEKYLLCLTNRPNRICIGDYNKEITYSEFDRIIEQCLLPQIWATN